jgi:hypothetical protein
MGVKIARGDMEMCRIWNKLGYLLSPLFLHALTVAPSHRLLCFLLISHIAKGEILRIHELE